VFALSGCRLWLVKAGTVLTPCNGDRNVFYVRVKSPCVRLVDCGARVYSITQSSSWQPATSRESRHFLRAPNRVNPSNGNSSSPRQRVFRSEGQWLLGDGNAHVMGAAAAVPLRRLRWRGAGRGQPEKARTRERSTSKAHQRMNWIDTRVRESRGSPVTRRNSSASSLDVHAGLQW